LKSSEPEPSNGIVYGLPTRRPRQPRRSDRVSSPSTDLLWSEQPDGSLADASATDAAREQEPVRSQDVVGDRFFRRMVQCMRNGVLAITRDGRLAVMNEVAYRVFGLEPAESDIGRPFGDVLHDQPDVVRILGSAFELNHLPNRAELRLKATGKVIGYTLSHIQDEEGALIGATLFFKDLTRVEQIEERERLRDRLAALGEMAAAMSHELKNPLAGIEITAGLLKRQVPDSPDLQQLVADIINETKLANAIVLEVLEFVRPIRLEMERTSIAQILHDAVRMAEAKVNRRDVAVTMSVQSHLPLIQGDHHQLCRLFMNLLINAFEALNGRGTIAISATQSLEDADQSAAPAEVTPLQTLVVEVSDDGPGVPPEIAERIFNPFFTTKPKGSGLGLAIVRNIVDAHNGRIDLTTAPAQGTRFRVTLPVTSGDAWFG
jgi:signal transduction histidine kinase